MGMFNPPPSDAPRSRWTPGTRVLAHWAPDGFLYPGTILEERGGQYRIGFDDGERAWVTTDGLAPLDVSEGTRVFGRWQGAPAYYPGTVAEQDGERLRIQYDDGDEEWTTVAMVRVERA